MTAVVTLGSVAALVRFTRRAERNGGGHVVEALARRGLLRVRR